MTFKFIFVIYTSYPNRGNGIFKKLLYDEGDQQIQTA